MTSLWLRLLRIRLGVPLCALVLSPSLVLAQPTTNPNPASDVYGHFGIGTTAPSSSAMLDIVGSDAGILLPRLTQAQRNSILNPAVSLLLFNTTSADFNYYVGPGLGFFGTGWDAFITTNNMENYTWTLFGNSGTNSGTNFLGTTDATDLTIRTANSERVRVTSNGNVGVNTTAPTARLQVTETDGGQSALGVTINNAASGSDALVVGTNGTGNAISSAGNIVPGSTNTYDLGTNLLRWNTIFVNGTASIHLGDPGNEVDIRYNPSSDLMGFDFNDDTTPETVIGDDGSIGIGVSSIDPSAIMDLNSTTKGFLPPRMTSTERDAIVSPATGLLVFNTTTNGYDFNFGTSGTPQWESVVTTAGNNGWLTTGNTNLVDGTNNFIGTLDDTPIRFVSGSGGPNERMRIDASGNIGIGTSNPQERLDVLGTNSDLTLTSIADDIFVSDIRLRRARGTVAAPTPAISGYNLGMIRGQGYDGTHYVTGALIIMSTDGETGPDDMPGRIVFSTTPDGADGAVERMRIRANGNVGIGTTDPDVSLTVDGGLAVKSATANVTSGNTPLQVSVANRSYIRISSTGTTANRTVTLGNGSEGGQVLIVQCTSGGFTIPDSGNQHLNGDAALGNDDTITLIWDGSNWIETCRSNN